MAIKYVSQPIALGANVLSCEFYRADLEFVKVDHSGCSYEGRVFLNNADADENTETGIQQGYAGSYHIFGHGQCYGDEGHCSDLRRGTRVYDKRPHHPLTSVNIAVTITDTLKAVITDSQELTVTVVPVIRAEDDELDMENVLKFDKFKLLVYERPDL